MRGTAHLYSQILMFSCQGEYNQTTHNGASSEHAHATESEQHTHTTNDRASSEHARPSSEHAQLSQ